MVDIKEVFKQNKLEQLEEGDLDLVDPKQHRINTVRTQLETFFKISQRIIPPTADELHRLINKYFNTTYTENLSKYTLHTYLGLTESNVTKFILTNDVLKEIYDFAIEKLKAKAEIQLQIAGRSTDAFVMQNLAGWRKKDIEEKEDNSGLADFHDALDEYNKDHQ